MILIVYYPLRMREAAANDGAQRLAFAFCLPSRINFGLSDKLLTESHCTPQLDLHRLAEPFSDVLVELVQVFTGNSSHHSLNRVFMYSLLMILYIAHP
jgi:hypothetical protein